MKGWNTVVLVYTVQYVTAGDHMISTLLYAVLYNDKYVLAYFFLTFCDHIFTSCMSEGEQIHSSFLFKVKEWKII